MVGRRTRQLVGGWELVVALPILMALIPMGGCATYTDHVRDARTSAIAHQPKSGVTELNRALGIDEDHQYPEKLSGENALFLLERATLLQAMGKYELAARDMMLVDQRLDWLDIAAEDKAKIGKYMYSGSSVRYRAPAYERVLLNALNAVNFLAMGNWEGAKVEARRFEIIQSFFRNEKEHALQRGTLRFANYIGGVAFEAAGDFTTALRYYSRAWHYGLRWDRFRRRLEALAATTARDPAEMVPFESEVLAEFSPETRGGESMTRSEYREAFVDGEVVAVVQTGFAPYKEGRRFPILEALAYTESRGTYGAVALTASERERARKLAVSGALKWVNFPVLTERGLPPTRGVTANIGGESVEVREAANVEYQVEQAWERIAGTLMAAAISRTITRAVAGAAAREGTEAATEDSENSSLFGALAQILVEGSMAVADKPDTRSWSLLPSRIRLVRTDVPPGERTVRVGVDGHAAKRTIDVRDEGPTVVNFSRLR